MINKLKKQLKNNIMNSIKYFNILSYIGFLSASVLSFKYLFIYIIFLGISIIFILYKKEKSVFKYIVVSFIILYGIDTYLYNNQDSKANLITDYQQIYDKCKDREIKCNKENLDDSYNHYLKYTDKLSKFENSEKCIFIMHEIPKLYIKLKPFYNMSNTSNNFLDFYINDFYECLKNNKNKNTYTLLKKNITYFERFSEEYKNTYFDLKNKYSGDNRNLKSKIKYVMNYMD